MFTHSIRWLALSALGSALLLSGCGSNNPSPSDDTTKVSGKVSLSSVVSSGQTGLSKPDARAARSAYVQKLRSSNKNSKNKPIYYNAELDRLDHLVQKVTSRAADAVDAEVYLFNADHPEWLAPVAKAEATSSGGFTLSSLINASLNGDAYTDGAPIPSGKYTLIAVGQECSTSALVSNDYPFPDPLDAVCNGNAYRNIVGVQAVVEKFVGDKQSNLTVQRSNAKPKVVSVMGRKLTELTQDVNGVYDAGKVASNHALQISFNMAMKRSKTAASIAVKNITTGSKVEGKWKMSPDLSVVTFYPSAVMTVGNEYEINIDNTKVTNYYGKGMTSPVAVSFVVDEIDQFAPEVVETLPASKTTVDISSNIVIEFDETIDINELNVTANTRTDTSGEVLGIPTIRPLGNSRYQILPSKPLQLDTFYEIRVVGAKDLAGNEMLEKAWQFATRAESNGVDTSDTTLAASQAEVKRVVGAWLSAINNSDIGMFGSLLTGDMEMRFTKPSGTCPRDELAPCAFDKDRDGKLSYDEFVAFIEGWFAANQKVTTSANAKTYSWTGDVSGVHLLGDVPAGKSIVVDTATGIATFAFEFTYAYGKDHTSIQDKEKTNLYLSLVNANGAWLINGVSERELSLAVNVTNLQEITATDPSAGKKYAEGTRNISFTFNQLPGVTSYGVMFTDSSDATGEMGWLGVVDATSATTLTVNYTSDIDTDASDGVISLPGGNATSPFDRALGQIKDGGRYNWFVVGFKTLKAADFVNGLSKDPEGDLVAWSKPLDFSIGGTYVAPLNVALYNSSGAAMKYSATKLAWDAGASTSISLKVTSSTAKQVKAYVYGMYYGEYTADLVNGAATLTVNLYNGNNRIDVTDGVNWWFSPDGNDVYTSTGITPEGLMVGSVKLSGTDLVRDPVYNRYTLGAELNATAITITGKATPNTVVHADVSGMYWQSNMTTSDVSGYYSIDVPVYAGFNWIYVWDSYGGWINLEVDNQGAGAVYVAPITIDAVNGNTIPSCDNGGSYVLSNGNTWYCWTKTFVVNTPNAVTVSGHTNNTGMGTWNSYSMMGGSQSGSFNPDIAGNFSFTVMTYTGDNSISVNDAAWNYANITVYNESATIASPHEINAVKDGGGTPLAMTTDMYGTKMVDAGSSCYVTIEGSSSNSINGTITLNYGAMADDGSWVNRNVTVTADGTGVYAAYLPIYNGTQWIGVSDANWLYRNVSVTTTCPTKPIAAKVTSVVQESDSITLAPVYASWSTPGDPYAYYWYEANSNTVKFTGTAESNAAINVTVSGSAGMRQYSATADSSGNFTVTGIALFTDTNWIGVDANGSYRSFEIRANAGYGLSCGAAACTISY